MRDDHQLRLLCLTRLWLFSRALHNIGNMPLWTPISHRTLLWSTLVGGPWALLLATFGVGLGGLGLAAYVVPPGLAVWWVTRMVDGGTRPAELVRSWVCYGLACRPARTRLRVAGKVRTIR